LRRLWRWKEGVLAYDGAVRCLARLVSSGLAAAGSRQPAASSVQVSLCTSPSAPLHNVTNVCGGFHSRNCKEISCISEVREIHSVPQMYPLNTVQFMSVCIICDYFRNTMLNVLYIPVHNLYTGNEYYFNGKYQWSKRI
jgi:hypothetical protein